MIDVGSHCRNLREVHALWQGLSKPLSQVGDWTGTIMPSLLHAPDKVRQTAHGGQTTGQEFVGDMRTHAAKRSSICAPGAMRRGSTRSFPFLAFPRRKPPLNRYCGLSPVFASYASIAPSGIEEALERRASTVEVCSQGASSTIRSWR
jgi:hypothetical protein